MIGDLILGLIATVGLSFLCIVSLVWFGLIVTAVSIKIQDALEKVFEKPIRKLINYLEKDDYKIKVKQKCSRKHNRVDLTLSFVSNDAKILEGIEKELKDGIYR